MMIQDVFTNYTWTEFFNSSFFIQFFILYTFYNMYISSNLYNVVLYLAIQIFFFGIFLSYINMELFTAFLWMTEVVVILICFFLIFTVSPSGNIFFIEKNVFEYKNFYILLFGVFSSFGFTTWNLSEIKTFDLIITNFLYDDYYEAYNNFILNDIYGLYLSFYTINSIEFLVIGFILLIGSVVAVKLNKFLITGKTINYTSIIKIFENILYSSEIFFLRKQNLTDQQNTFTSSRTFQKKK